MPAADIATYLGVRSAICPSVRSDGRRLAFVSDHTGVGQGWMLELPNGAPQQFTQHEDKVSFVGYAPVGKALIYGMDAGGDERIQFYLLADGAGAAKPLTRRPKVIHIWGGWSPDAKRIAFGANIRDQAFFDVYVMDVATGEEIRVFQGDGHFAPVAWSPDGKHLAVIEMRGSLDIDLHLLEIATGKMEKLLTPKGEGRHQSVRFAKDGKSIYLSTDLDRDFLGFARLDLAKRKLDWLHAPDWDVELVRPSHDDARVAHVTNVEGYGNLAIRDMASGKDLKIELPGPGIVPELTWLPDGSAIVFTLNGACRTPDLFRADTATGAVTRLTTSDTKGLQVTDFVEPELIRYPTFDGRQIPAFFFKPKTPKPASGYPTVMVVHGGPESQYLPNFRTEVQFLIARGYAVLATNVRGSSGYGRVYLGLDDVRLRPGSVNDLAHANAWLRRHPDIDGHRIAVMGQSYGGYMVLAAITLYPDLWAAGIDFYGIANWLTMLANTGPWRRKQRAKEYGDPERDREFLIETSPLTRVGDIKCPLLVAQGMTDPRVPPSESEQIVKAVRSRNVPCEYVTFPDEGHGFVKLHNRLAVHGAVAQFLDRFVGGRPNG
ncbi:MAG: S9 family peptidase [Alphaproteobacteria bacterium]|nr:S9 family peptidase [Alphaproteobacteria bacterium]